MAQTKAQKEKILDNLRELVAKQKAIILIGISGLKVKDLSNLRKRLKSSGADLKVIKKTLAGVIFKENKMEFDRNDLKTEMGFVFGFEDEVSPAKTVYLFQKENEKLKILGGFIEKEAKKEEEIVFLAQLPTRQELFAKLTGSLLSPVSGFINVLNGNIKGLILALNAISKNKQ